MKVTEIMCKSGLSKSGIYGWDYALNPYRGCIHGCHYCYSPNILRVPRRSWGTFVGVKKNMPIILAKELKRLKPGLVGIASVTDPYQNIEEKTHLTRYCLEQLLKYNFPVSIITKSPLILRDIDLIKKFPYSELTISITTLDKSIADLLEPNAPGIDQRLDALTKLSSEGLNTYAFLGPLIPILEPDQVSEFVGKIHDTGVKTIMVDSLNLKPGIWTKLNEVLNEKQELKDIFHKRLFLDKDYYRNIFSLIKSECNQRGIKFE